MCCIGRIQHGSKCWRTNLNALGSLTLEPLMNRDIKTFIGCPLVSFALERVSRYSEDLRSIPSPLSKGRAINT